MSTLRQWLILMQAKCTASFQGIALVLLKRFLLPVSVALACASGICAQRGADDTNSKWRLKDSDLQLLLHADGLVIESAPKRFFSSTESGSTSHPDRDLESIPSFIPISSITAVICEVVARKPVQLAINQTFRSMQPKNMLEMAEGAGEGAIGLPALPVALAASAGAMAPFRGVKTNVHSVRILWTDNVVPRSADFILSARDAESFGTRVAQITGVRRMEAHFDSEIKDEYTWQILLHFTQPVSVGVVTVSGGTIRLLGMRCPDGTTLVYFFSVDKPMPRDALAAFVAESSPLGTKKPWKVKLMRGLDGSFCFTEIDTDTERLLIRACQAQMAPSQQ